MRLQSHGCGRNFTQPIIGKITRDPQCIGPDWILYSEDLSFPEITHQAAVISPLSNLPLKSQFPVVSGFEGLDYLAAGDIVQLNPNGFIRVLIRRNSRHNFLFATDECNSLCLMCSQPPKEDDFEYRKKQLLRIV